MLGQYKHLANIGRQHRTRYQYCSISLWFSPVLTSGGLQFFGAGPAEANCTTELQIT
jgi:hypothetical protein